MSELSHEEKTVEMAESVFGSSNIDVGKERKSSNGAVLVNSIVRHLHVTLAETMNPPVVKFSSNNTLRLRIYL